MDVTSLFLSTLGLAITLPLVSQPSPILSVRTLLSGTSEAFTPPTCSGAPCPFRSHTGSSLYSIHHPSLGLYIPIPSPAPPLFTSFLLQPETLASHISHSLNSILDSLPTALPFFQVLRDLGQATQPCSVAAPL